MKKYRIYGLVAASRYIGEFEATSKEEAEEMAWDSDRCYASICHQCSGEVDIGDIYELQIEEID